MIGAWPFHDHYKRIGESVNRGLFGGIVVKPRDHKFPPEFPLPAEIEEVIEQRLKLHVAPAIVPVGPRVEDCATFCASGPTSLRIVRCRPPTSRSTCRSFSTR